MTEVDLDASVVVRWLERDAGPRVAEARALRREYESGRFGVLVPPSLYLEVLNVAGRQWRWGEDALLEP